MLTFDSKTVFLIPFIIDFLSDFVVAKTKNLVANETIQFITSPNYPQFYGSSNSMTWMISASGSIYNPSVYIRVTDSDLQPSLACYNDVVSVYDGISSLYPELASWCGSGYPTSTLNSKFSTLMISFSSDDSDNNYRGFKIAYWAKTNDDVKYVTRPYTALNYTLLGVGGAIILTIVLSLCAIIGIRNRDKISSLFTNEDV